MSIVKVQGNASGTGTLTLSAPNTNTDRTLTLPDSSGTVATAESTLAQFNASGSAPVYAARAWVNFNGTGTVAIRASGNVTSITDNGTGDHTVNFTTAMPDANYSYVFGVSLNRRAQAQNTSGVVLTTSIRVLTQDTANAAADSADVCVSVFR